MVHGQLVMHHILFFHALSPRRPPLPYSSSLAALLTYQEVVAEVQHLQPLEHAKLDGEGVAQQVAPAVPRQHQAEQVAIAVTVVGGLA